MRSSDAAGREPPHAPCMLERIRHRSGIPFTSDFAKPAKPLRSSLPLASWQKEARPMRWTESAKMRSVRLLAMRKPASGELGGMILGAIGSVDWHPAEVSMLNGVMSAA